MMLSAASPSVDVSWPQIPIDSGTNQYLFFAAYSVLTGANAEGGYIRNNLMLSMDGTNRLTDDASPSINDLLSSGSTFGGFDGFDSDHDGGAIGLFETGLLAPQTIDFTSWQSSFSPTIHPERDVLANGSEEGGLISLQPILNPGVAAGGNQEIESLGKAPPVGPDLNHEAEAPNSATPEHSLGQISGEWARAVVFEVAGGEPVTENLTMSEPQGKSLRSSSAPETRSAQTLEKGHGDLEGHQSASRRAAVRPGQRAVDSEKPNDVTSRDPAHKPPMQTESENVDLFSQFSRPEIDASLFDRGARLITSSHLEPTSDVLAAAFDQIGGVELPAATPSPGNLRLNSWLGGTPLLLILALDRFTARRARARQTSSSATAVERPQQL